MCSTKQFIIYLTIAEAYGTWKAVGLCRNIGLWNILLEGDAIEILNALWMEGQS
jgi:hypothetical protein